MTQNDYRLWMSSTQIPHSCVLGSVRNVSDSLELNDGLSLQSTFPENAEYWMDPEFPNDTVLTDNLINTDRLIIGSLKLKEFLSSKHIKNLEYLPVSIRNHKGKIASRDYFIINPIQPVDGLNIEESGVEWGLILPDSIDQVARIVLIPEKIDPERQIFRLKSFSDVTLVRRELANEIDQAGFKGIRWLELSDYPEL